MRLPYDTLTADGLKALGGVYGYVMRCGLEKSLVDLCYLRASQINGCAYCVNMHTRDAIADGASIDKLMLVSTWRDAESYFSVREQAALAWTEAVTCVARDHVPDEVFEATKREFSAKELSDLTLAVGIINVYNRMAISFRRAPQAAAKEAS